jgi:tRNA (guanine6-N2)-methyltransferase
VHDPVVDDPVRLRVRCVRGLEWVAADEVRSSLPRAGDLVMANREVSFSLPRLDPALLALRTVDDVFLVVGQVDDVGSTKAAPQALSGRLAGLGWGLARHRIEQLRALPARPGFDVVASLEGRRGFNRFDVEHAVGAATAPLVGGTYLARTSTGRPTGEPDLTVRVFVRGETALAAVRLGRRPLHRRDYKQNTGKGTLHPPLAAALCRLAAPSAGQTLADPFCGDGTIAIEAALAAPGLRVVASDLDADRLASTRRNAELCGVQIDLHRADAGRPGWARAGGPAGVDLVVTNPPWNVSVDGTGSLRESLDPFWGRVVHGLTAGGRLCAITDGSLDAPTALRRRGFQLALATQTRIAGRVSHVLLAAPPGSAGARLPPGPARWRRAALAQGLVTEDGF